MAPYSPLLYLNDGLAFYRGHLPAVNLHQHHAVELIVSEQACQVWNETDCLHQGRIALLGADVAHRFVGNGGQWFIYVEPEGRWGKRLIQHYLSECSVVSLPDSFIADLAVSEADTANELKSIVDLLFRRLVPDADQSDPALLLDLRINQALTYIKEHIDASLSIDQLTNVACLSEGRLIHLFKEQVGIPIRKCILWNRLQTAVQGVLMGQNLTQAAHEAGFADSAHFSRTFSDMFGIRPSAILVK